MQEDNSLLAIKTVQHASLKGKLKANLFSEIDIMRTIIHPHIVALVDILESTNHIHLVMEYCQLGDLAAFVKKRDKLGAHPVTAEMARNYPNPPNAGFNEVVVRHFAKQLGSALEFLDSKNFVHRDLKPQNLLLNPPRSWILSEPPERRPYETSKSALVPAAGLDSLPFLKVADFGFARYLPTATMAETLCGSPLYMAPEILRYEKYDSKADLWSVGTVLYELMVGKPPFRAANHVDLLRKIEKTDNKIKFPEELAISDAMMKVIIGCLKRMPEDRISWKSFFTSAVIIEPIPGLVGRDRPRQKTTYADRPPITHRKTLPDRQVEDRKSSEGKRPARISEAEATPRQNDPLDMRQAAPNRQTSSSNQRQQRPALHSHSTAPNAVQGLRHEMALTEKTNERPPRTKTPSPGTSAPREPTEHDRNMSRNTDRLSREARERAAQDVAFERDYVMVEKRAVEVNAFADELAASPHLQGGNRPSPSSQPGAMVRRATTQGTPTSQNAQNRQVAVRPEQSHQRRPSYERRYGPQKMSAQSALAAALNMVNLRFNSGPFAGLGKGPSPPQGYGPFPAFPASAPSPLLLEASPKPVHVDEDQKVISVMEDSATRSDVVYGFAEVKYKQLIPISPSNEHGLGIRRPTPTKDAEFDDDDLTPDAIVTISEEALVLYVKALAILTNTINIAGSWWTLKRRSGLSPDDASNSPNSGTPDGPRSASPKAATIVNASVHVRINSVVQWARNRFNECLEKSEFVSRKLLDAQGRLPLHHPGHPSKRQQSEDTFTSSPKKDATTDKHLNERANEAKPGEGRQHSVTELNLTSGITAEKLMYDRALEMSRTAAVNELVGEDLAGCEVSYLTAMRLLEAVLEKEGDTRNTSKTRRSSTYKKERHEDKDTDKDTTDAARNNDGADVVEGFEDCDRKTVEKCEFCATLCSAPPIASWGLAN